MSKRQGGGLLLLPMIVVALQLVALSALAQEFTFGVEEALDLGKTSTASKDLEKGLKLYDAKDYAGATQEFYKVVTATDVESERFKGKAEYSLGKALYRMGLMQSSLNYFNRIAETGREHKYHRATLKWLFLIYRALGDPAILEKIAVYDVADYPENFRNGIAFLVGSYHYRRGNLDQALTTLRTIGRDSDDYARAKFLEGVLWVRKNQAQPAVEAFREILRVVMAERERMADADKLEQLARLSMARIFYSTGQYDLAIKYYDQIPQSSEYWLQALFEESWAYFQKDDFPKSLGNLHTLESPFFEGAYFPESGILRAVIYFTNCRYKETRKEVERFLAVYPNLEKQLATYLQRYAEPDEFWGFLVKLNTEGARFPARLQQLFGVAFKDKEIVRQHRYITHLDEEVAKIGGMSGPWAQSPLAAQLIEDLTVARSLAVHEAGRFAKSRLERVRRELSELKSQALKIKFEVANAEVGRLESQLQSEQYVAPKGLAMGDPTATDDEHLYWPFRGEYWKDELGSYLYDIRSECGR